MKPFAILSSFAALLLSILGTAVGQESPKPVPALPDIPGLPAAVPAPEILPGGSPPAPSERIGAGDASPDIPGLPAAPAPAPKMIPTPPIVEVPRLIPVPKPVTTPGAPSIAPAKIVQVEPLEPKAGTGQSLVREAKVKVLQEHYAAALSETLQLEKAVLSAEPEERAKMEAKVKAMRDFVARLEAELQPLTAARSVPPQAKPADAAAGTARAGSRSPTASVAATPAAGGVPGLDGAGTESPRDAKYGTAARLALEKMRAQVESGLMSELDYIVNDTLFKKAHAGVYGKSVEIARATRDGAQQRLEHLKSIASSSAELAKAEAALAEAESDLQWQEVIDNPSGYNAAAGPALEKIRSLLKSGQGSPLDFIKAETITKKMEAVSHGDSPGIARAARDGAKQRLEYLQSTGASSKEVAEAEAELSEAESNLRWQKTAANAYTSLNYVPGLAKPKELPPVRAAKQPSPSTPPAGTPPAPAVQK